ncbi:MAG: hypothetical protein AABZ12_08515 [Planctomycetota bacterium]
MNAAKINGCLQKDRASAKAAVRSAFTLFEILLVAGLMAIIAAFAIPNFSQQVKAQQLPSSADQFRTLLALVGANATFDGKRYRVRFPGDGELDFLGGDSQPLVEREDDPLREPEVFQRVTAPWASGATLVGEVRCFEVRLGRQTIASLQDRRRRAAEEIEEAFSVRKRKEKFQLERLPLYIEPDGTSDWATFVLSEAPPDTELLELDEHPTIEVILEGPTGQCWLQRPLHQEELDLFEENGWPAVLRQDFLRKEILTEDDVLELRDIRVKPP